MTFQFGKRLILSLLCLVLIQFESVSSKRFKKIKENPVKYYTVLGTPGIQFGTDDETQTIVVTREEVTSSVRELHSETESSNQITTSAEISAVYGGFSASASVGYTHDTRSLDTTSETREERIKNSVEKTYKLKGSDKVFATLVEMDMFVFKVGKRREYIKLPTGITIASVLDKQNLQDKIYDKTVNSFAKRLNLKMYSEKEIRDRVSEDLIPEVNAQRFPKTGVYYRLKNKVQPFTWLKYWKGNVCGCAPWDDIYSRKEYAKVPDKNRDDELWKFEKYGKKFLIYNKRFDKSRLIERGYSQELGHTEEQRTPGLYSGKIGRDQQVSVKVVDEAKNMVKIKMVQSKRWFSMWKEWKTPEKYYDLKNHFTCGFETNPRKDENIWILEPAQ